MLAGELERLDAVSRADRLIAMRLQKIVEELHVELVVLHDQDGFRHPEPLRLRAPRRSSIGHIFCGKPDLLFRKMRQAHARASWRDPSCDILRKGKHRVMRKRDSLDRGGAESLAIQALTYLASDPERLARFLALAGIWPNVVRHLSASPGFLAGVLDHIASDEPLLIAFADEAAIDPA